MPKQLIRNTYVCVFCNKEFDTEEKASNHELNDHDIVYVGLERTDLNRLINYISITEDKNELLTRRLIETLYDYMRGRK